MIFLPENAHELLFSPATLKLGEIHWCLLKAANLIDARRTVKTTEHGRFSEDRLTDFGRELGYDEIHWWVFNKETHLGELRARTAGVLDVVQRLKNDSAAYSSHRDHFVQAIVITRSSDRDRSEATLGTSVL